MMYRMAASQQHLMVVLGHLDAWSITLVDVVTEGDEMIITLDAAVPADEAEHLELIEVT